MPLPKSVMPGSPEELALVGLVQCQVPFTDKQVLNAIITRAWTGTTVDNNNLAFRELAASIVVFDPENQSYWLWKNVLFRKYAFFNEIEFYAVSRSDNDIEELSAAEAGL